MKKEERKLAMVGMDAISLFPSMSGKRTGRIVRERISKGVMKIRGFCWKKGMVYIKINRHLTSGIPAHLKKFLPVRKSSNGTTPGMASKTFKRKGGGVEEQWIFGRKEPTWKEMREMVGIIAERHSTKQSADISCRAANKLILGRTRM